MSGDVFERYKDALKAGHLAAMRGRHEEALSWYAAAAALADQRALPHIRMGSVLLEMGRVEDALRAYELALQRAPGDIEALAGRAVALRAAGREPDEGPGEPAESDDPSEPEAEIAPEEPPTGVELADAADEAAMRGDDSQALEAWVRAAQSHAAAGEFDAALDACIRALSVSLGAPALHLEMARLYFLKGWRERGAERLLLLDRLLSLDGDPRAREELAELAREHADDARLAGLGGTAIEPGAATA